MDSVHWLDQYPESVCTRSSGVEDVWFNYYDVLAQYREFQKVWNATEATKEDLKIFNMAAAIFLYGEMERMVDLFGEIPFFEAGLLVPTMVITTIRMLSIKAMLCLWIYVGMNWKSIVDQMKTLSVGTGFQASFKAQDIINNGNLDLWRRYANSLAYEC